ncbi:MAG TPA: glycosyltransferase [Longimicrobium sp.]|nr:glycosyltransferase [Longimicrobium sp.]
MSTPAPSAPPAAARPGRPGRRVRVRCLPLAGRENPYQHLMMEGLGADPRLDVAHGADGRWFAATRTALRDRPDFIHYDWNYGYFLRRHGWLTLLNAALFLADAWVARRLLGARIAWTMHNLTPHDFAPSRLERATQRAFARGCAWVRLFSPLSVARAAEYLRLPPARFRTLPMGSYEAVYPDTVTDADARAALGIGADERVVLYFGALRPYKGVEELIDAFRAAAAPHWRLVVAGSPRGEAYVASLHERAAGDPRIAVHARSVPEAEVQTFFRAADVVALPFRNIENSSSVVLAMGFGRPVVAPALGVLPERLAQQAELLYAPGELAGAIARAGATADARLRELGELNREAIRRDPWESFSAFFVDDAAPRVESGDSRRGTELPMSHGAAEETEEQRRGSVPPPLLRRSM